MQNIRPILDSPNVPVHDGTYFDCLENVTERAKVVFKVMCKIKEIFCCVICISRNSK